MSIGIGIIVCMYVCMNIKLKSVSIGCAVRMSKTDTK